MRGKPDPYLKIGQVNQLNLKSGESANGITGDYVWALKDINLEVKQGEVLGIIGKNGAGKSTLLKILSRVTSPTSGSVKVKGRIGSLLEVGTGFHPEMTGRENIFMNGTIMGMTRHEITRKLDDIVDFAGVSRYIDTPVKRYSSGMKVRLGFAVAAFLEPEILVVDEVLAVGDAEFQKRAIGKMGDVTKNGRTILFVSHNINAVKNLSKKSAILENGNLEFVGDTDTAINNYLYKNLVQKVSFHHNETLYPISLLGVTVSTLKGRVINIDSDIIIDIRFQNLKENANIGLTLELVDSSDLIIFHQGTSITMSQDSKIGNYSVRAIIPPKLLNSGVYFLNIIIGENQKFKIYEAKKIVSFEILNINLRTGSNFNKIPGVIVPNLFWKVDYETFKGKS